MEINIIREEDVNLNGTHKVGSLWRVTYSELLEAFGKPLYGPENSADGKVNYEWVFEYNGENFSVYDWKTYDEEYTRYELTTWSVGGKSNPDSFLEALNYQIDKIRKIRI